MKKWILFMWLLVPAMGMAQEVKESGRGQEVEVGRDSLRGSDGTGESRKGSEREEKPAERKERRKFVWGGEREVKAFEFEAGLGVRGGADRMGADRREAGLVMFVEVRHNL